MEAGHRRLPGQILEQRAANRTSCALHQNQYEKTAREMVTPQGGISQELKQHRARQVEILGGIADVVRYAAPSPD